MYTTVLLAALTVGNASPAWGRNGRTVAPASSCSCFGCYGYTGGAYSTGWNTGGRGGAGWGYGGCHGCAGGWAGYAYPSLYIPGSLFCNGCYGAYGGYSCYGVPAAPSAAMAPSAPIKLP